MPNKAINDNSSYSNTKIIGNIDQYINDLSIVTEDTNYPLTVSINGEWGAGKTTLLKKWVEQKPNDCIYIDAFATDYIGNPLAVILAEFSQFFKNEPLFQSLSAKKIDFDNLTKNGFAEAVKILTSSIIDLNSAIKKQPLEDKITDLIAMKEAISIFKETVGEITKDKPKLYIFIDELDRCKPKYAAEFIEVVKHFFNIHNTVFIFAINRKELTSSIKHIQGCDDPDRYLKKFFDLNYELPSLPHREFVELLVEKGKFGVEDKYCDEEFIETLSFFSEKFSLHPRDREQCFDNIMIALKKMGINKPCQFVYILIFCAIIREGKKDFREYYNALILKPVKSNSFSAFNAISLTKTERTILDMWVSIALADTSKSTTIETKCPKLRQALNELQVVRNRVFTKDEVNLIEQLERFSNRNRALFNNLPDKAYSFETLAQYIDSLLNFSQKFYFGHN